MKKTGVLIILVCVMAVVNAAFADTIRGIEGMTFVTIGNAGNAADTQVMVTDSTTGYGAVVYEYRIGKYEVTNAQWGAFTAAAGAPTGNPSTAYDHNASYTGAQQPTNYVSWYEAAQFCNYLTSGDKSKGVYLFSGNNANPGNFQGINRDAAKVAYETTYFLPTEDEWYKAAYYTVNGYSLYANGLNTIPSADNGWNYSGGSYSNPWNVGTGIQEQNGTFDMMGNVWEWNETLIYDPTRGLRGGGYNNFDGLASSHRYWNSPDDEYYGNGFRIASVVPVGYECQEKIAGDLNGDCAVNLIDYAIMAESWLKKGYTRIYNFPLDSVSGWTIEGQWEFGLPTGNGGYENGNPDPTTGYTGPNVYGVNLNGDYDAVVGGPFSLTAGPVNCSQYNDMKLKFARWLNTDEPDYVLCRVEVSNNATNWTTLWQNIDVVTDSSWQIVEYDVSETADNQTTVYFRWSYEIFDDRAYPYSGWNIDDIELLGKL